jgi:hypothetical protein
MNGQQGNWPPGLLIYLGLLAGFAGIVGFVLPACMLFGILPNSSIAEPVITALTLMALVFLVYFPWMFQRLKASPKT